MSELLDQWCATVAAAGSDASPAEQRAAGEDLLRRWGELHRRYHTVDHLAAMLATLRGVDDAVDRTAIELAAWFHDAVYDPRRPDNEEASAVLAERVLGELRVPARRVAEVARLVRLTSGHDPAPDDRDGALLCDVDLAILAAAPSAYRRYAEAVRREYAHVPDGDFRRARAAILRSLLARPALYRRPRFRDKWEKRARINLAMELSALTSGPSDRKPLLS